MGHLLEIFTQRVLKCCLIYYFENNISTDPLRSHMTCAYAAYVLFVQVKGPVWQILASKALQDEIIKGNSRL